MQKGSEEIGYINLLQVYVTVLEYLLHEYLFAPG